MDYSWLDKIPGAITKGPRHVKVIAKVKQERKTMDEQGSDLAKARANGRCEVTVDGKRCPRVDRETHHRLGGNGRRGRGASALAKNKSRACSKCHRKITDGDLVHVKGHVYRERQLSKGEA